MYKFIFTLGLLIGFVNAQENHEDSSFVMDDTLSLISVSNVITNYIPKEKVKVEPEAKEDSIITALPGNWGVMLTTQEFDDFRRILLIYKDLKASKPELIEPKIIPSDEKKSFQILLNNVNPSAFIGDSLIKSGLKFPIQLTTQVVDNQTLVIDAKVKQYSEIVSYQIMGEHKFIIDVYKKSTFETFFKEKTIPGGIKGAPKNKHRVVAKEESPFSNIRSQYKPIIFKSLLYAGLAIGLFIVIFVLLNRRSKKQTIVNEKNENDESHAEPSMNFQETLEKVESDVVLDTSDEYIRKIMDEKQISYDEAIMMVNIQGLKKESGENDEDI